jgi:hypothetical protein
MQRNEVRNPPRRPPCRPAWFGSDSADSADALWGQAAGRLVKDENRACGTPVGSGGCATACRTPDTDGVIFSPWKSVRWSILTTTHDFNVWISPVVVWVQQAQLGSRAIDGIGGLSQRVQHQAASPEPVRQAARPVNDVQAAQPIKIPVRWGDGQSR